MTADFWAWVVILLVGSAIGALVVVINGLGSFTDLLFVGVYTETLIFSLTNLLFDIFSSGNELLFITGVVLTICAGCFSVAETLCALVGTVDRELKKRSLLHWTAIVLPSAALLGISAII